MRRSVHFSRTVKTFSRCRISTNWRKVCVETNAASVVFHVANVVAQKSRDQKVVGVNDLCHHSPFQARKRSTIPPKKGLQSVMFSMELDLLCFLKNIWIHICVYCFYHSRRSGWKSFVCNCKCYLLLPLLIFFCYLITHNTCLANNGTLVRSNICCKPHSWVSLRSQSFYALNQPHQSRFVRLLHLHRSKQTGKNYLKEVCPEGISDYQWRRFIQVYFIKYKQTNKNYNSLTYH